MSEVICISDSEESCRSKTTDKADNGRDSDQDSEFYFPAVEFPYEVDKPTEYDSGVYKSEEDQSEIDEPLVQEPANSKKKQNDKNVDAAMIQKKKKIINPEECLKLIQVSIDYSLEKNGFIFNITNTLDRYDISWKVKKLPISNSIMWITRNEYDEKVTQEHILIIWNWDNTVNEVYNNTFEYHLKKLFKLVPNIKPTLILCGMDEYFQAKRTGKQTIRIPINKGSTSFYDAPKITRDELETDLVQIQQNLNCSCKMIHEPENLGPLVYRFTKSIAQIPCKKQKTQKQEEKLDWYASGDNRDTVRVDNCGNGLSRLWQQQLCQFTLSSLETAEAISSVYPSPNQLIAAYKKSTKIEGEKLLKDIPIRRAAGHLSTVRKIGPELSKKIYTMFTSKDGKATLDN